MIYSVINEKQYYGDLIKIKKDGSCIIPAYLICKAGLHDLDYLFIEQRKGKIIATNPEKHENIKIFLDAKRRSDKMKSKAQPLS
jgi:hypothetical protein